MNKLDKIFSTIIVVVAVAALLFGLFACCTGYIVGIAFCVIGATMVYIFYSLYGDEYGGS